MLRSVFIQDVVLIEALDVAFAHGLCALTGETGAGKSILLDSLGLALGGRGDTGLIRQGAPSARVSVEFELPAKHPVFEILDNQGIACEGPLVLRRMLGADGRSRAFINDQPVSVGLLRDVGDMLVDIHGQFETRGLMDAKTHRATLDAFAQVEDDVHALGQLWQDWRDVAAQRDALVDQIAQARRDQEYWQDAYEDLSALDVQDNEEDSLLERRAMLVAATAIAQSFAEARALIDDDAGGAVPNLNRAWRVLERVAPKAGEKLSPALDALDAAIAQARGALDILDSWFDDEGRGPDTLEAVDERLFALRTAARKHRCQVAELPQILVDIEGRLSAIKGDDTRLAVLDDEVIKKGKAYRALAQKISAGRMAAAAKLDAAVMGELAPLKLEKARFETCVDVLPEGQWGQTGMDDVRFMVATNPGAAAGPLNKIASGGELSRFMLAIKVVLAGSSSVPVMVFDEVDAGLGGATADAVGERLARLAKAGRQVLVVTHSPQVAARANAHWIVSKAANEAGDIRTTLVGLAANDGSRTQEIARMISGAQVTPEALAAADKLLQQGA